MAGGCLSLFGLPFLAAGLFMAYLYFSGLAEWWLARSWEEVPCRIESVEMKRGDESSKVIASYRYRYQGREYPGDRVSFYSGSDNVGSFQHDAFRELSAHRSKDHREFRCFVNPAQPEKSVLYRTLRWQMQVFLAAFALTFPAVGAGLVVGGLFAARSMKREAQLRENFPAEPWKWKSAWAESTIPEAAGFWKPAVLGLFAYVVWAGLVILPLLGAMASGHLFDERFAWTALILPALWCIPAWMTLKRIRHWLAVGETRLDLSTRPVNPGGPLHGYLLLARPLPARTAVEYTLVCEKLTTRKTSDGNATTREKVWSHSESVSSDRLLRDLAGCRLPVQFTLPSDAPESSEDSTLGTKHVWMLGCRVPGTAIRSHFEIPVFQTGAVEKSTAPLMVESARGDLGQLLASTKIQVTFDAAGYPRSIICPPGRYLAVISFFIIFNTIWTGVSALLILKHAPLPFAGGFSAVAAVMWLSVIWMAMHRRTVILSGTGLEIQHRLGPVRWGATYPKGQIFSINHDTNMSSGNRSYYRVRLVSAAGKKQTLVDGIDGESTAAALAERLEDWRKPLD